MRILVDITAHGFGHLSQTAPILAALRDLGDVHYVVRSGLRTELLRERLGDDIVHVPTDLEFGLVMQTPFQIDRAATMERYKGLHARFNDEVSSLTGLLQRERCDGVLSNMGFLAIAAGMRAGVPTVACSSLNWGDVFAYYCGSFVGSQEIWSRIDETYRSATEVCRLVPGMPMTTLATVQIARPIARLGRDCRAELRAALALPVGTKVVLLAFGGMFPKAPPPFVLESDGMAIIGPRAWAPWGVIPPESLHFDFSDLVSSADLVITKAGYGIVAELGCSGTPAIFISRNDWPEEPYLLEWLQNHCRFEVVPHIRQLNRRATLEKMETLAGGEKLEAARCGGERDVVSRLAVQIGCL